MEEMSSLSDLGHGIFLCVSLMLSLNPAAAWRLWSEIESKTARELGLRMMMWNRSLEKHSCVHVSTHTWVCTHMPSCAVTQWQEQCICVCEVTEIFGCFGEGLAVAHKYFFSYVSMFMRKMFFSSPLRLIVLMGTVLANDMGVEMMRVTHFNAFNWWYNGLQQNKSVFL